MLDETTPLNAPAGTQLDHRKKQVRLYLGLLSVLFTFPMAASQIATYDLLFEVVCRKLDLSGSQCTADPGAAKAVADLLSAVPILNGLLATAVMVFMSALSDRTGRKRGLLWFMTFTSLATIAYPLIGYSLPANLTHWRMLIPFVLIALSGTPTLLLTMSVLYITDSLPEPTLRTEYLSLLLGVFMLVQALAPGIGGALLQHSGMHLSKYLMLCALWMGLGTIAFWMVIEEPKHEPNLSEEVPGDSHVNETNTSSGGTGKAATDMIKKAFNTVSFAHCEPHVRRRNALILLLNFFFSNEFAVGFIDIIMVYAKHKFGWVASRVGETLFYSFSVRTGWALLGFPFIYPQLTKRWPANPSEVDIADIVHMLLSTILTFFGYVILGLSKSSGQYTAGAIVLANDGISGPIWINALLKHVPDQQKGGFMGMLSLVNKPAGAILPAILMKYFQLTIDTQPSSVFYIVSGMAVLLAVSLAWLRPSAAAH